MSDHAKFVSLAQRLIDKHGRQVSVRTLSSTPTDGTKPWKNMTGAPTDVSVKAAFVPFRGFEFGSMFIDDELLKRADQVCLIQGSVGDFESATQITDDGISYKIEWARRLKPGDQVIVYAFGVRR